MGSLSTTIYNTFGFCYLAYKYNIFINYVAYKYAKKFYLA